MFPLTTFNRCAIGVVAGVCLLAGSAPAGPVDGMRPLDGATGQVSAAAALDEGRLSLVPLTFPVPETVVLGPRRAEEARARLELQGVLELSLPRKTEPNALDIVGEIIEAQDEYWPLGTVTTAHFEYPAADKIGNWKPFLSVLQDADEADAHIRNGVGAGVTYRFSRDARVDVEAMYLDKSGDVNPNLGHEGRVSVVFSFNF